MDRVLREGRMIQRHLVKSRKVDPAKKAKIFAKLVMEEASLSERGGLWRCFTVIRTRNETTHE